MTAARTTGGRDDGTRSLWDAEDAEAYGEPLRVRDMTVGPASVHDVDQFCRRYHYTSTGGSAMWRYGLWDNVTLLGVIAYNIPTRETCESVFGPDYHVHVLHMGRLAVADRGPRNSESYLIAGSLRLLVADRPDTWAVLTYAATDIGHIGYVYQATNAIYTGTGGDSVIWTDSAGRRRSTYLDGSGVSLRRGTALGWTRTRGGPKHRYVYLMGTPAQRRARRRLLRLPSLPYPKNNEDTPRPT